MHNLHSLSSGIWIIWREAGTTRFPPIAHARAGEPDIKWKWSYPLECAPTNSYTYLPESALDTDIRCKGCIARLNHA